VSIYASAVNTVAGKNLESFSPSFFKSYLPEGIPPTNPTLHSRAQTCRPVFDTVLQDLRSTDGSFIENV
jgi:hypothetical protein